MIARISALTAALVLAAGAAIAAAAPASAGNGGGSTSGGGVSAGCQGDGCDIDWWQWVKYSGTPGVAGESPPGSQVQVEVQQPPCTWDNIGDQISGSNYILNLFDNPAPDSPYNIYNSYQLAEKLVSEGPDAPEGTWYNLPTNSAASPAAQAECLKLPAFVFVPPGQTPPLPPIPPRILAELGFNHMKFPVPAVHTSPAGFGYVNLATYVWWTNVPAKILHITAGVPGQSATVVAKLASVSVSGSGAAREFNKCRATSGSSQPRYPPPATGAGVGPDCGVLWTQPDQAATITVTLTWDVLWHPGPWRPGGNPFYGTPVRGAPAAGIQTSETVGPLTIREIQSVNGAS